MIKITERPTLLTLDIGKRYMGNIVESGKNTFFFSPRDNGIHVFNLTNRGKVALFVQKIHVEEEKYQKAIGIENYMKLLKEEIIPSFFKGNNEVI